MVLSKEDRVALLAKAREAKARKKAVIKEETDEVEDDFEPETKPTINLNLPDPEPEPPTPKKKTGRKPVAPQPVKPVVVAVAEEEEEEEPVIPKKKQLPLKWLKNPKPPEKVCCDKKLTKEEPLIKDEEPQVVPDKHIVVPSKSIIKKPKAPRASTRTLELVAEPKAIEEVLEEVKNNDVKYQPIKKASPAPPPPTLPALQPITIRHIDPPLRLFDY